MYLVALLYSYFSLMKFPQFIADQKKKKKKKKEIYMIVSMRDQNISVHR